MIPAPPEKTASRTGQIFEGNVEGMQPRRRPWGASRGNWFPPEKPAREASVSSAEETRLLEEVAACPESCTGQYLKKMLP